MGEWIDLYAVSGALVVLGVVVLGVVLVRVYRELRVCKTALTVARSEMAADFGWLRARSAGLRVGIARRCGKTRE